MNTRSISLPTLLFASISAILGSGWMFSAFYTSEIAGPAAILSWVFGGIMLGFIAFTFAELSAMIPITGSSVRIPQYTHGTLVGFVFSWFIWLSYVALVPTEVQGVIQYATLFFPQLTTPSGQLTHSGYYTATTLMLLLSCLNVFSLRWLMRANSLLTLFKIALPLILAISVFVMIFHTHSQQHIATSFSPFGYHGIFAAISTGGITFAFNGFKQACEMAGEAKRPAISLPIAIIGSIVICLIIYLLLQLAFLGSLNMENLQHGWAQLALKHSNSPISSILIQDHLSGLLPLLYIGAVIGPLAAALMYIASAGRSMYGISHNGCLPSMLMKLNTEGNPVYAIILNFLIGLCLFAPLPGWDAMVAFLTSLIALSYAIGPVCLVSLRLQIPELARPLKLPFGTLWAFIAFFLCNCLAYWTGWANISKLFIAIIISLVVLAIYRQCSPKTQRPPLHAAMALWLAPYFIGLSLISYLGSFGGGINVIPFGIDIAVIFVFSMIILWLAIVCRLPSNETQQAISELHLRPT